MFLECLRGGESLALLLTAPLSWASVHLKNLKKCTFSDTAVRILPLPLLQGGIIFLSLLRELPYTHSFNDNIPFAYLIFALYFTCEDVVIICKCSPRFIDIFENGC
jgi:hypothetical protein